MPIVILEGPDGGGKSTLAKELLAGPCKGWRYEHNGTYEGMSSFDLFKEYTAQLMAGRHEGILLDRSFDSEGIYGPVIRKEDRLGKLGRKLLNRLCSAVGAVQVVCLPPKAVAENNWQEKVTDYVKKELAWNKVYDRYEELVQDPRYVRYDYTWNEGRTRKDLANRFRTMIQISAGQDSLPEGYVGSPRARYLFVGEQVSLRKAWVDLPFFALSGVSAYLAEVLEEAGLAEEDVALVNAYSWSGYPTILQNHPRTIIQVIALGHLARKACAQAGVPADYLPHPNYVMRFNKKRTYVKKLKELL
jgi:hypothetical protein